ncbi:hypothetical protein DSO57_1032939 [Entomophthora muscae]|uniref:Uncharacterized protein n=1 Tax=Entomophthora muscae TaxID=34485 RepID=A0ACC2RR47_9FUNG|nr:hypothetical protein DSO57_1032939 [Entomophthora muscae]
MRFLKRYSAIYSQICLRRIPSKCISFREYVPLGVGYCFLWRGNVSQRATCLATKKICKNNANLVQELNLNVVPLRRLVLSDFKHVQKLVAYVGSKRSNLVFVKRVLRRFQYLRWLELDYHNDHPLDGVKSLIHLRHFRFASCTFSEPRLIELISQNLPEKLRSLELRVAGCVTNQTLVAINKSLPLLRHLKFEELDPLQLDGGINIGFPELHSLHLAFKDNQDVTSFNFNSAFLPSLKTLVLNSLNPLCISSMKWPQLKYFESPFALNFYPVTPSFISITTLCLRAVHSPPISPSILSKILERLINLRKLVIWEELKDDSFDIPTSAIQDVTVTLSDSPFSPNFFIWVTRRLPNLKSLYLRSHEDHEAADLENINEMELPKSFGFGQPRSFKSIPTRGIFKKGPFKRRFLRAISCNTGLTYQQLDQSCFANLLHFSYSKCLKVFPVFLRSRAPKLMLSKREVCHLDF